MAVGAFPAGAQNYLGEVLASGGGSNPASGILGKTPAEVAEKFPAVIWQNLTAPGGRERFAHLTSREVFKLAVTYTVANNGDAYELAGAIRDTDQRARYLKAAQEVVGPPGGRPRAVRPGVMPHQGATHKSPMPNIGMTLDQIYLEFRTAPVGSLNPTAALYETGRFAGWNLGGVFFAGYSVGTAVSYLLQNYAPDTMDALVGRNLTLLIDGSSAIVLDSSMATLLVQDSSGYGLGDFGVTTDLSFGPAFPWEDPTPIPSDPMSGWGGLPADIQASEPALSGESCTAKAGCITENSF